MNDESTPVNIAECLEKLDSVYKDDRNKALDAIRRDAKRLGRSTSQHLLSWYAQFVSTSSVTGINKKSSINISKEILDKLDSESIPDVLAACFVINNECGGSLLSERMANFCEEKMIVDRDYPFSDAQINLFNLCRERCQRYLKFKVAS
jgi:hypothetical protein